VAVSLLNAEEVRRCRGLRPQSRMSNLHYLFREQTWRYQKRHRSQRRPHVHQTLRRSEHPLSQYRRFVSCPRLYYRWSTAWPEMMRNL
jgi:hypothetical protein